MGAEWQISLEIEMRSVLSEIRGGAVCFTAKREIFRLAGSPSPEAGEGAGGWGPSVKIRLEIEMRSVVSSHEGGVFLHLHASKRCPHRKLPAAPR